MALHDLDFENCSSVTQLHQGLLQSMLHQNLPTISDPGILVTSRHRFSSSVYITLKHDYSQPSIPLKRFRPKVARSRAASIFDNDLGMLITGKLYQTLPNTGDPGTIVTGAVEKKVKHLAMR
jgi:hypothetical protein